MLETPRTTLASRPTEFFDSPLARRSARPLSVCSSVMEPPRRAGPGTSSPTVCRGPHELARWPPGREDDIVYTQHRRHRQFGTATSTDPGAQTLRHDCFRWVSAILLLFPSIPF